MNDIFLYVAIGLGALFLVLLILAIAGKGEALRKWLGPVGGLIIAIVAIMGIRSAGGDSDLAKIRAENERLEKELKRLEGEVEKTNAEYAKAKAEYEARIKALDQQLEAKEAERKKLESELRATAEKDPIEWLKSLPAAEREKIKKEINSDINWI